MNVKYKNFTLLLIVAIFLIHTKFISRVEAGSAPISPEITTLWVPVETGVDDAEENIGSGKMSLASSDLELIQDGLTKQKIGLRFTLDIPAGAFINEASIQFTSDENSSDTTRLIVHGEASVNALAFSSTNFDISNRTLTVANVPWTPPAWTNIGEAGTDQESPDLSEVVQEIVNQAGWIQGNSIVFVISGDGKRVAESFNGTAPAKLYLSFSTELPATQLPDAVDDGTLAAAAYTTGINQQLIVSNGVDDIVERNDNVGFPVAAISSFDGTSNHGGVVAVNLDGGFTYSPALNFSGVDQFSYTLTNTEGSDSATVYINVEQDVGLTTLWIPVVTGSDDAEQNVATGSVSLSSSDLELIRDLTAEQVVGVRFQALNIPQGSTIVEAYIQFTADESSSETTDLTVYGEDSVSALTFATTKFDISNRSLTTANVEWLPASWNTNEQTSSIQATPDLSAIVQEIVNRTDWVAGSPMAFITTGSGQRVAESFNGTAPPVLHVSYSSASIEPPVEAPNAMDDGSVDSAAYTTSIDQELIVPNGAEDIIGRNDNLGIPEAKISSSDSTSVNGGIVSVAVDGGFSYTPPAGFFGFDSFNYVLSNTEGSDSATVYIKVLNARDVTPLSISVSIGSDDAEQDANTGNMDIGSSDLEMVMDKSSIQLVGVRFQGIEIPPGALIKEASIQYTVDENTIEQTVLTVSGEASVNATTFTNVTFDITNRTKTSASVEWIPPAWNIRGAAGPEQRTPDLSGIVQEIIDQDGWAEGNSMVFITSGIGHRVAESFNGTAAPTLHLVYSITSSFNAQPTATDVTIIDTNGGSLVVGDELLGTYKYNDGEGDTEGASIFTWLRDGVPIVGATTTSYTTVPADAGKFLTFKVIPVAVGGSTPGDAETSSAVIVNFELGGMGPAGGIIFYIGDGNGMTGLNGLEISPETQGQAVWGCYGSLLVGADGVAVGTGAQNTADILLGCTEDPDPLLNPIASKVADDYKLNGFADWHLPSIDETLLIYEQRVVVGLTANIWSSTQKSAYSAFFMRFAQGDARTANKFVAYDVRPVRGFSAGSAINSAPVASNVFVQVEGVLVSNANINDTLIGVYDYFDLEGETEASTYRWLRNGTDVVASTISYIPVAEDLGTTLTFEVTPIATSGTSPGIVETSPGVAIAEVVYAIGDRGPAGGIVFYITAGGLSGLETAPEVQGQAIWGCYGTLITGADGTGVGTSAQNTADILQDCPEDPDPLLNPIAAKVADDYILNGFDDWTLPSLDESVLLYAQKNVVGNISANFWSSTEKSAYSAWFLRAAQGDIRTANKFVAYDVRPVRAFTAESEFNSAPVVSNGLIKVAGVAVSNVFVDDILTGTYDYSDLENDIDVSSYRWLKNGTDVVSTTISYIPVAADVGAILTFEVTAKANAGTLLGNVETSPGVLVKDDLVLYAIGDTGPAGGIVFHVTDGGKQGLETAPEVQGQAIWGCYGTLITGADGTGVGTSAQNTTDIRQGCPEDPDPLLNPIAAKVANNYSINGFDDWSLPSIDEAVLLYAQKDSVGNINANFWSSTEKSAYSAWFLRAAQGDLRTANKFVAYDVRPVRAFSARNVINSAPVVSNVSIKLEGIVVTTAYVGDNLTGMYDYFDVEGDINDSSYRWLIDGTTVVATSINYIPVAEDVGSILTFEVTPAAIEGISPGTVVTSSAVMVEVTSGVYAIGDTGPAGGIVFYLSEDGLHGLEAAPIDQSTASPWGCFGSLLGVFSTAVGTGLQNTADTLMSCAELGIAAEVADLYIFNGFSDWFLPSSDELNEMYANLHTDGLGGFVDEFYWSSTESASGSARYQSFGNGNANIDFKVNLHRVRAIRTF